MDDTLRFAARNQFTLARALILALVVLLIGLLPSFAHAEDLLWPLGDEKTITGGFADTRPDHFHGGLDIHTGPAHLPVMAPADGWIERITVIPPGYGRVLYYRLPDGRTAVFGHLDHFNPVLEKMLRDSELVTGTYAADLIFDTPSSERQFKRGDILAYTGHTGAGPAHFHYEIREGTVQTDPLLNYGPKDTQSPVIVSVRWTTLSDFSPTGSGKSVLGGSSKGQRRSGNRITATEPVAFFVQAYDPGPWGRNATPYIMRVSVNGVPVYMDTTARIDLAGPRDIYAKTVRGFPARKHLDLWRLFDEPASPGYADSIRDGHGWLRNLDNANVAIEVVDRAGNVTSSEFTVTSGAWPATTPKPVPTELRAGDFCLDTKNDPVAAWASLTEGNDSEVRISPSGLGFGGKTRLSHCLHDGDTLSGAYLFERSGQSMRGQWASLNVPGDTMSCEILRGGTYGIGYDHEPPTLTLLPKSGGVAFRLTDNLSGVDYTTIRCKIDNQTAIAEFEYEERGGDIWTQQPLAHGPHDVTFTASDRAGNSRTWHETVMIR
jgi:hypothetical protein